MAVETTDVYPAITSIDAVRVGDPVAGGARHLGVALRAVRGMARRRKERAGVVLTARNTMTAQPAHGRCRPEGGPLKGIPLGEVPPSVQ